MRARHNSKYAELDDNPMHDAHDAHDAHKLKKVVHQKPHHHPLIHRSHSRAPGSPDSLRSDSGSDGSGSNYAHSSPGSGSSDFMHGYPNSSYHSVPPRPSTASSTYAVSPSQTGLSWPTSGVGGHQPTPFSTSGLYTDSLMAFHSDSTQNASAAAYATEQFVAPWGLGTVTSGQNYTNFQSNYHPYSSESAAASFRMQQADNYYYPTGGAENVFQHQPTNPSSPPYFNPVTPAAHSHHSQRTFYYHDHPNYSHAPSHLL
jgi:hypothetical protein